ncbi:MAG: class I SAM-dependent methyltransferase [Stellaceae bacterium]
MPDHIVTGKTSAYRAASEALHRDQSGHDAHADNLRVLWECGLADVIRNDFYTLLDDPARMTGDLLDAGCGTGIETRNLARLAPGLRLHGIDISSVVLAGAVADLEARRVNFYQAALEILPFAAGVFDGITSHEVIEHVEDPAVVLREFFRVLKAGGICLIATPNGTSLWVEHLRQRVMRLFGKRGAPIGADHTRPVSFWRREFARAGFIIEHQLYDGAALEFLAYVAPASWMAVCSRVLEPLRVIPVVGLLVCDRVKFRLRKPGAKPAAVAQAPSPVCPVCHDDLTVDHAGAACQSGHHFARNAAQLVDFTSVVRAPGESPAGGAEAAQSPPRRSGGRRLRRLVLAAACLFYVAFIAALLPLGMLVGTVYQPFGHRP